MQQHNDLYKLSNELSQTRNFKAFTQIILCRTEFFISLDRPLHVSGFKNGTNHLRYRSFKIHGLQF